MRKFRDWLHYLFVPSEKNNLRAKALHNDFLTVYLVIALTLVFSLKTFKAQITNVLGFATDISTQRLYELTNEERLKNNLRPLNYNAALATAANLKALDMFSQNYWAHFSPNGRSPWDFILNAGYSYKFAGENLAKNFLFSSDVVSAWMSSPTHRENIVRGEFSDVGYAVVNGTLNGEETTLVVQMFGTQGESGFAPVQAEETAPATGSPVVAQEQKQTRPLVLAGKKNLSTFSFDISYIFIGFLIFILIVDLYFAYRMNIFRITSKNLAHILFLLFIFAGFILYITKGAII